jgi:predicted aminopeptidase
MRVVRLRLLSFRRWRTGAVLAVGLALLALAGCRSAGYYGQALSGQWQILVDRQPISQLIASSNTPPDFRNQLELFQGLRRFAETDLRLPAGKHYLSYVDLHRPHVVWNVFAAPEFSIKARTWWYPLVGSLEYHGYFNETNAQRYGGRLAAKGWDVAVEPVDAYSTLGWFREPVLSSFIDYPESELAGVLFHELAHQRLFVSGDTDFNEAFATTVEQEGVRRWLRANRPPAALTSYERDVIRDREFVTLVLETRRHLERLYTEPGLEESVRRARKQAIFEGMLVGYGQLKKSWGNDARLDRWFGRPLNNAHLNTISAYHGLQAGFARLLDEQGGDLERFYSAARRLGQLSEKERHQRLRVAP